MVKIKTLVEKLDEGHKSAFKKLDEQVKALGDVVIKKVNDVVHPEGYTLDQSDTAYIERIVVYRDRLRENGVRGKAWMPTLDTDLMEFIHITKPDHNLAIYMEEYYGQGKTTIRELIAMPKGWFDYIGPRRGNGYDRLKRHLNKYGFKLFKKGNVIDD